MSTNSSVEQYFRFLSERLGTVKGRLEKLIDSLSKNDQAATDGAANDLRHAAGDLRNTIADGDCPGWLKVIETRLRKFNPQSNVNANFELLKGIIIVYDDVQNQTWDYLANPSIALNFDGIYEHFRDESRIPELYDHLIILLEKVLQSGEIDSNALIRGLERLVATLKQNRRGSFFSTVWSWQFGRGFLKNGLLIALHRIPVLGEVTQAIEKTMEEMDIEFDSLESQMKVAIQSKVVESVPKISHQGELLRLQHGQIVAAESDTTTIAQQRKGRDD